MIFPPFIKPDSLVGLVTPAGKIAPGIVKDAESFLHSQGLRSIKGEHVATSWHQFSARDEHRLSDLNSMIANPEVDVIWCMRGGYGAIRIIDKIDFALLAKNPKWIVGFSDITVFHSCLQNRHALASIHGSMPKNITEGDPDETGMNELWQMLRGNMPSYNVEPHPLNRLGNSKGVLCGGNLTLLSILKGSSYDFDPKGRVLFIEDVGEYLYSIDRMMRGLAISGKLSRLSGLVVGQMSDLQDNQTPFGATAYEIIAEVVKPYNYPVIFNFPSGHKKINKPLMFGAQVKLTASKEMARIDYLTGQFETNGRT